MPNARLREVLVRLPRLTHAKPADRNTSPGPTSFAACERVAGWRVGRRAGALIVHPIRASRTMLARRFMSTLASPSALRQAVAAKGAKIDLRTPEEIQTIPAPAGSLEWDFRASEALPSTLPEDKSTPLVLF